MFNSTVLDVAIGLIFTFFAISLTVSAIVEAIASIIKWRSRTLLQGIKDLLNDENLSALGLNIYNHALVNPRDRGNATNEEQLKNLPAYINPNQFADALIDIMGLAKAAPGQMKALIDGKISDPQLRTLLYGMVDRSTGEIDKIRDQIASWFDNSMDRISGIYKRKTQACSFAIALLLSAGLNVSAINIGIALWQQPLLARTIAPKPGSKPLDALKDIDALGVPVGWSNLTPMNNSGATPRTGPGGQDGNIGLLVGFNYIFGWIITAIATLFGAPFWFDTLQQIVRLKGAGPSPEEKQSGLGAAA
jgi:hypothetical protein